MPSPAHNLKISAAVFGSMFAACAADGPPLQDAESAQGVAGGTSVVQVAAKVDVANGALAGRGAAPASAPAVMPAAADSGGAGSSAAAAGSSGSAAGAGGSTSAVSMQGVAGAATLPMNAAGAGGSATPSAGSGGMSGAAASGEITVWLAGDSTVAKGNTPCPVGWGAAFQALFKPQAKVVNSAVGGRSVRTWLYEVQTQMDGSGECALNKDSAGEPVLQARWQSMLDGMKSGDYLFIQFGINDSSATCDRHVGIEAFKESYGMMAEAAKMRGAQPVFVTPVSAISCEGSKARPTRGGFVTATLAAGESYDVPVIDLHERSIALYNEQGLCPIPGGSDVSAATGGKAGAFFCDDHTHFSDQGAEQIAQLMAHALKDEMLGLAGYLK